MLTGEKKKLYQRNYMRMKRAKLKAVLKLGLVRPKTLTVVRPSVDADGNVIYDD